jgi:4-amino-4-deoxy-L-arabinose transferase-like glycosyltransferase
MLQKNSENKRYILEIIALLCILLLAAYLRLVNLIDNPRWYTDEATHLEIAQNLSSSEIRYFAVDQSFLLFARMPLFELLLAGAISIFGSSMTTLRSLTGLLGVLSVGVLYFSVRKTQNDRVLPLLAAFMLAIYPQSVLYSRFGFSYALLTPLVILTFLGSSEYWHTQSQKWLLLAVGSIGVGLISDLMIASLIIPLLLVVIFRNQRDLLWALPLIALPFGLYALIMLFHAPDAFLFDLDYTLNRMGGLSLVNQFENVGENYTTLLSLNFWIPLGIVGLFLLNPSHIRRIILLLLLLPIFILGRTVALYSLSFYYFTPLLPFIALGMANLVYRGGVFIWQDTHKITDKRFAPVISILISLAIIGTPLFTSLKTTMEYVRSYYPTQIDAFLISGEHARKAADYVNKHAALSDVVITSPTVGWLIEASVADFSMSIAFTGEDSIHIPGDLSKERFVFNPSYQQARFVIVDNIWRNWGAVHMPHVAEMLRDIETWELVFEIGQLQVYENQH